MIIGTKLMINLSWNGSIKMTPHPPVSGPRKGGVETDYSSHAWLAVQKECTSLVRSLIQLTTSLVDSEEPEISRGHVALECCYRVPPRRW